MWAVSTTVLKRFGANLAPDFFFTALSNICKTWCHKIQAGHKLLLLISHSWSIHLWIKRDPIHPSQPNRSKFNPTDFHILYVEPENICRNVCSYMWLWEFWTWKPKTHKYGRLNITKSSFLQTRRGFDFDLKIFIFISDVKYFTWRWKGSHLSPTMPRLMVGYPCSWMVASRVERFESRIFPGWRSSSGFRSCEESRTLWFWLEAEPSQFWVLQSTSFPVDITATTGNLCTLTSVTPTVASRPISDGPMWVPLARTHSPRRMSCPIGLRTNTQPESERRGHKQYRWNY